LLLKGRSYPIILLVLDALLRRLPKNHPKLPILQGDYNKRMAGYWGEKRLDEFLDGVPNFPFYILRDLSLNVRGVLFQIDTLILTPFFVLILESKNIAGNLLFDTSFNQLIRTSDSKEEAFDDPILQSQNQRRNLINWFKDQKIPLFPIETLVVMSNSSAVVKSTSGNEILSKKVIPVKKVLFRIEQLTGLYQKELFSYKELRKIAKQLIKNHQPKKIDVLKKYKIEQAEIIPGVQCPNCSVMPMIYKRGKWLCTSCETESKDAHLKAVDDFLLLVNNTITNKAFRDFLLLPSMNIASKLLIKMGFQSHGAKKSREYYK
jgi:hypothetical protein